MDRPAGVGTTSVEPTAILFNVVWAPRTHTSAYRMHKAKDLVRSNPGRRRRHIPIIPALRCKHSGRLCGQGKLSCYLRKPLKCPKSRHRVRKRARLVDFIAVDHYYPWHQHNPYHTMAWHGYKFRPRLAPRSTAALSLSLLMASHFLWRRHRSLHSILARCHSRWVAPHTSGTCFNSLQMCSPCIGRGQA